MKATWFLGGFLAASAALSAPAFGQVSIGVTIGTPPPPIQYEVPPPMPTVGYVWTNGYWAPYGGRYIWHRGYWARPPYYGAAWRPARWVHEGPSWRYYEGGWGPRQFDGPPPREFHSPPGHAYGHYKDKDRDWDHDHGDHDHGHHGHD